MSGLLMMTSRNLKVTLCHCPALSKHSTSICVLSWTLPTSLGSTVNGFLVTGALAYCNTSSLPLTHAAGDAYPTLSFVCQLQGLRHVTRAFGANQGHNLNVRRSHACPQQMHKQHQFRHVQSRRESKRSVEITLPLFA